MKRFLRLICLAILVFAFKIGNAESYVYVFTTDCAFPGWPKWIYINGTQYPSLETDQTHKKRFWGFKQDVQKGTVCKYIIPTPGRHHFMGQVDQYLADITINVKEGETYYLSFEVKGTVRWNLHAFKLDEGKAQKMLADTDSYVRFDDVIVQPTYDPNLQK